ncbi:MAG: type II secretion system ATPase GspE [Methyloprofundus sp.]|nr:type II secretion system ATPase GspE [Methyloprofundus sp.]MDT8425733.1 type II secretion system ATPase GspE [Methyloprofundus sp.]
MILPYSFSKNHGVLLHQADQITQLWIHNATQINAIQEARRAFNAPVQLLKVPEHQFNIELQRIYHSGSSNTMQEMEEFDDEQLRDLSELVPEAEDLMDSTDDAPIIRLINAILTESIKEQASDIHIEPFEERLRVRFRVDGILREVLILQKALASLVVSRIKVMAKLDIAEKRLPQDGRISLKVAGHAIDLRVSTLPSGHGERVVMRLLDKQAGRMDLSKMGMLEVDQQRLGALLKYPHGIILVTGPTGSGKTTTLYAGLTELNQTDRSIMTIEDPIEYHLDGISQTAVNTKIDMDFSRGLRAILRQDPDIVMVGEIRDSETAHIAVQASLTGHLVLSTLHTNTAVGAISRLMDMGIEPFLLSSSLLGVLAQRLVRTLCPECRKAYQADTSTTDLIGVDSSELPLTLYKPVGCPSCHHLGYQGRMGIYEIIQIDGPMRDAIHNQASATALEKIARQQTQSIRHNGFEQVKKGLTTLDEVLRVTKED